MSGTDTATIDAQDPKGADGTETKDSTIEAGKPPADPKDSVEFNGPYDEERAKTLIAKLRAESRAKSEKLLALEKADKERREAEMTELQRAQARAEEAERKLADAETDKVRAAVAKEFDVPESLLNGTTKDEMTARAKALAEWRKPAAPSSPSVRPKAALVPGTGSSDDGRSVDPVAMADRIRGQL